MKADAVTYLLIAFYVILIFACARRASETWPYGEADE